MGNKGGVQSGWERGGEWGSVRKVKRRCRQWNEGKVTDRETEGCENEIYCAAPFQSVEKSKAILWRWALSCFIRLLRYIPQWANLPRVRSKRPLMHTVKSFKKTSVTFPASTLFLQGEYIWVVLYAPMVAVTVHHSFSLLLSLFLIWVNNTQCSFDCSSEWEALSNSLPSCTPFWIRNYLF